MTGPSKQQDDHGHILASDVWLDRLERIMLVRCVPDHVFHTEGASFKVLCAAKRAFPPINKIDRPRSISDTKHDFPVSRLDDFYEPMVQEHQEDQGNKSDRIYVSAKNPALKPLYTRAAAQTDELIRKYLEEGTSFVTEKTGQYWYTVRQFHDMVRSYGFDPYCIFVSCDPEMAWQSNSERKRVFTDRDEFMDTHAKAKRNIVPSETKPQEVVGFKNLFGPNYYEVINDRTPENNERIQAVVDKIVGE